jgi:ABC-type dipeptide/oligopeptide/nickel transport system permease component
LAIEEGVAMFSYALHRLLQIIPVILVVSFAVFFMVNLIPGDPVLNMIGPDAPHGAAEAMREKLGLNDPLLTRYFRFMSGVLKGDLGTSIFSQRPVSQEILGRYKTTLKLAIGGTIVASLFGVLFGVIAAVNHNKFLDNLVMIVSLISVSTPSFFLALLMMLFFSLYLRILPSTGLRSPLSYILPILTLGTHSIGMIARTTRSAMLDVLGQDYIRTSRSGGLPNRTIIYSHALKNVLIPVVTVIGLRFGGLLAGSALVESVFAIPGLGRLLIDGVLKRDYPVVQGTILVISITFVIVNTVVDLLYAAIDPRIKYK